MHHRSTAWDRRYALEIFSDVHIRLCVQEWGESFPCGAANAPMGVWLTQASEIFRARIGHSC